MKRAILALVFVLWAGNALSESNPANAKVDSSVPDYNMMAGCDGGTTAETLQCDSSGKLSLSGSYAEDSAHTTADVGLYSLGVYSASPTSSTATANDYASRIQGPLGQFVDPVASTTTVCATLTPDTAAYAAGDAVLGASVTDPISIASLFRTGVTSGTVTNIEVHNTEVDAIGWTVILFDADPSTSTTTDQSALTIADADLAKIVSVIDVSSCQSFADNETCHARNLGASIDGAATGIYAALLTKGAPTWAAAQTVTLCMTAVQD